MTTGNILSIAGMYFQYTTEFSMGIGTIMVNSGVGRFPFHGQVFPNSDKQGSMVDSLGTSLLLDFQDNGEQGWSFTKQYTGQRTHRHQIHYRFTERSVNNAYWIGEYRFDDGSVWGEAHAVYDPIETIPARFLRREYEVNHTQVLEDTFRELSLLPSSIMHLSRLPQVFRYGNNGVLPPLEEQDEDIRAVCTNPVFHDHTLPEAWVEVYCFISNISSRMDCSWNDVLQQAREKIPQEGSLLNALRSIHSDLDLQSRMEEYTEETEDDSDE